MTPRDEAGRAVAARACALEAAFVSIARTRMAGVPVMNPRLKVEAVGFDWQHIAEPQAAVGILITPWFMNLVWLPLVRADRLQGVGGVVAREIGAGHFEFIGAHDDTVGAFEACSLFSPMFEFSDQPTARATAQAVLANLREPRAAGAPAAPCLTGARQPPADPAVRPAAAVPAASTALAAPPPARRSFLFGRSAGAG